MARARGAAFFVHFGVCAVLAGSSVGTTFTAERPASGDVEAVAASQPDQRELDRIATLGYIAGRTPAGADVGVVVNNAAATFDGYTLFTYAKGPEAVLIDMDGNVLRSWSKPGSDYWARARLLPDGDLLVITCDPYRLTKLNLASETIWTYEKPAHHDFQVQEDGSIWVLTRSATSRESIHQGTWLLDDVLVHLDSWGRELSHVSLLEAFERSGEHARWVLESVLPDGPDIFHTNSLEIHDAGRRALVSIRELDIIAMVDLENGVTEWVCEGPWHKQHEARLLDGTALLFDNLGLGDQSRVLEFDCSAGEITWQYTAPGFLSKGAGAAQRLGNGNILITESESGRILEVDREGTTVWEYVTPLTVPGRPDLGLGIMRAERLARGIVPVSVCGAR